VAAADIKSPYRRLNLVPQSAIEERIVMHRKHRSPAVAAHPVLLAGLGAALIAAALIAAPVGNPHGPAALPGHVHATSASAQARVTTTLISQEKLAHVPGKTLTVELVEFPPGVVSPEHHHGGSVTAYILSGMLRSQLDGGPVIEYGPGQSFFEPPGTIHTLAQNPSPTEPTRFMAIHVADDGAQLTVFH
jgi:quercetin dioxygenase-like cupin family protein